MSNTTCSVDGCEKIHYGKTWCQMHYHRMRRSGRLDLKPKTINYCKVDGCGLALVPPYGRGMCQLHYQRFMKHGDPHYERPLIVGVAECTIDGCDGVIHARGWCSKHLTRWERYGDPVHRFGYEVRDGKRVCPGCGVDKPLSGYTPGSTGRCRRCVADIAALRRIENPAARVEGFPVQCMCGDIFTGNKKNSRYCSPECFQKYKNKANWKYQNLRRARLRNVEAESFDRAEIFLRDDWTCQLCGKQVNREAHFPDPNMASLDHIIPISRGGAHTRTNAQTAHLGCNMSKGAKLIS